MDHCILNLKEIHLMKYVKTIVIHESSITKKNEKFALFSNFNTKMGKTKIRRKKNTNFFVSFIFFLLFFFVTKIANLFLDFLRVIYRDNGGVFGGLKGRLMGE